MPGSPESIQPPLPDMPDAPVRFDSQQKRAFGSVPTLLGKEIDIPPAHRLSEQALIRTEPDTLRQGLYGQAGNNAVNGLALNTKQFEIIIRSQPAFTSSIRNKTLAANTQANPLRLQEKELKSIIGSLESKQARHTGVLAGLTSEQQNLAKLADWQRVPGYWRTREADLRMMAAQAWEFSFTNILQVLCDQHGLSVSEYIDMTNALAHKLVRGPQAERIQQWGNMLGVASTYNRSVTLLFQNSARHIELDLNRKSQQLRNFYQQNDLDPLP